MKNSEEIQIVIFELNEEEFGIDINKIKEIIRINEIVKVPAASEFIMGITNLRGNILPVINTRLKLSLQDKKIDSVSRMLVIEKEEGIFGFVVDKVSEVIRIKSDIIEKTPQIVSSVEREYIEGVLKLNDGKRLVLLLNVDEVLKETFEDVKIEKVMQNLIVEEGKEEKKLIEEEQLVTFNLGKEEYGFEIEKVREILRVEEITPIPNAKYYVKGVENVRGQLLPIIDLRKLFEVKPLNKEKQEEIDEWKKEFNTIENQFLSVLESKSLFNFNEASFINWIDNFSTSDEALLGVLGKMKKQYSRIFVDIKKAVKLKNELQHGQEIEFHKNSIKSKIKVLRNLFNTLENFDFEREQRILVVNINGTYVGITVDSVNEVKIIQKSVIEKIPDIISKDTNELKSAIKVDGGKKLIIIIDETKLISEEETFLLSKINSEEEAIKQEKTDIEEEQCVIFNIENEEYGIPIEDVKEINRIEQITEMPKCPEYVEGMTNLRGEIIPIISLRKKFGVEQIEYDNNTRIVITEIDNTKTGIIVDNVAQIIKISKKDLETTPQLMSRGKEKEFINGIAKLDDRKRMIMLLDIKKMLYNDTSYLEEGKTEDLQIEV